MGGGPQRPTQHGQTLDQERRPDEHRVARLHASGRFVVERAPVPTPAAHEVLVRVAGCGVCGSDLPVWAGDSGQDYPLAPGAPGHEAWGQVVATGDDADPSLIDQWVAGLCAGGYAEHVTMAADELVAIPDGIRRRFPSLPLEPLACAMNAFRRARIRPGDDVAVIGVGFIGAGIIAMAHATGARVTAMSRRPTSLALARDAGAERCVRLGPDRTDDEPPETLADVLDALPGDGFDSVVEATGHQAPLDLAGTLCRTRGCLVIAGYHQGGRRSIDLQHWNWRGLDVVNAHERDPQVYVRGMKDALKALEDDVLPLDSMITHVYDLDGLGQAFEDARRRPEGFVKAVMRP